MARGTRNMHRHAHAFTVRSAPRHQTADNVAPRSRWHKEDAERCRCRQLVGAPALQHQSAARARQPGRAGADTDARQEQGARVGRPRQARGCGITSTSTQSPSSIDERRRDPSAVVR